jgi:hypothetical protein
LGLHIQRAGFALSKEPGLGSRAYIPTWLPVARDEDGGSLPPYYFRCVNCKIKYFVSGSAM